MSVNSIPTDSELFDFVRNSDEGAKRTYAGVGNREPGFSARIYPLVLGIAKKAHGPIFTGATGFVQLSDWQDVETIMPEQALVCHALKVLSGLFWFDGQPFSPPQHNGDEY